MTFDEKLSRAIVGGKIIVGRIAEKKKVFKYSSRAFDSVLEDVVALSMQEPELYAQMAALLLRADVVDDAVAYSLIVEGLEEIQKRRAK